MGERRCLMRAFGVALVGCALVAAACSSSVTPTPGTSQEEVSVTTVVPATTVVHATTVAPTTTLPSGAASATCVNGWITPTPGTALRKRPLDFIRRRLGLSSDDLFIVDEMRYFTGPEDVEISAPRRNVERWYVEAHLQSDPSVAGRWLVRSCNVGAGIFAEAPAGTVGFAAGTWTSHEEDGTAYDPFTPACTAANGPYCRCAWEVDACSCSDNEHLICSGPSPSVMGCLDGL